MRSIVIASSKKWFIESLETDIFSGKNLIFIEAEEELNYENLSRINPEVVFFPHWNWRVEPKIYENFKCVLFHIAPLPSFRGGSPIQNLILSGYKQSPLSALRMTSELDAGEIYCSRMISLEGNLTQIFTRIHPEIVAMMKEILEYNLTPNPQVGDPTYCQRRTAKDNEVPIGEISLIQFYDRIRMLDHDEYPKAYLEVGNFLIEFTDAQLGLGKLTAKVSIFQK